MGIRSRFGAGFYLYMEGSNLIQDGAFGHGGAGGSIGFADRKATIGFGYVMNKMQMVSNSMFSNKTMINAKHTDIIYSIFSRQDIAGHNDVPTLRRNCATSRFHSRRR